MKPFSAVLVGVIALVALVGAARASEPVAGPLPRELSLSWGTLAGDRTLPGNFNAPAGLAVDPQGNVYVADSRNFRIEKLSPGGQPLGEFGTAGYDLGQFMDPAGVTVDGQGNLYVADTYNDRVQELDAAGQPLRDWGEGGNAPLPGLLHTPMDVAVDRLGDVYISEYGNHRVQKISALGAPLDVWGWNGRSRWRAGPGNLFEGPVGIALDAKGNIYVADATADRIRKLSPLGKLLATWGKKGTGPGEFREPRHLSLDRAGNIYVADAGNRRVQKLSPAGKPLAQWPLGSQDRPDGVAVAPDGTMYVTDTTHSVLLKLSPQGAILATWGHAETDAGELAGPLGMALDPAGSIYVADSGNARVEQLSLDGALMNEWSTRHLAGGRLTVPTSIAVDPAGDLYVVDCVHWRLAKVTPDGKAVPGWPSAPAGMPSSPLGVAVDRKGNAYVADWHQQRVIELSSAGQVVRQFGAGKGKGPGQFDFSQGAPVGMAVDTTGALFVADNVNDRIEKFSAGGKLLATWGRPGRLIGRLIYPAGLALDGSGNLYIADAANHRIQEWSRAGKPVAEWGALGTSAGEFFGPHAIALAPNGQMYVLDSSNDRIEVAVPRQTAPQPLTRVSGSSPYLHCTGTPLVTAASNTEAEVRLAIDPRTAATPHPSMIGVWIQDLGWGISAASSSDGGASWAETPLPFSKCAPHGLPFQYAGDPWVSIGPDGTAYAIAESMNGVHKKRTFKSSEDAIVVATSTDGGKTWTHARAIRTLKSGSKGALRTDDKPTIAADPLHAGVAYALWDTFNAQGVTASMAKTVDGGATWSRPQIVVPQMNFYTSTGIHQLVIDPHSDALYDIFRYERIFPIVVPDCSKGKKHCREEQQGSFISYLALVRSTDGGVHWSPPVTIANWIESTGFTYGNLVRTGAGFDMAADPRTGRLYVVWADARFAGSEETQTLLSSSDDGGATWTPPQRLSDLPAFIPSVAVSPTGTVAVSYYAMPFRAPGGPPPPAVYWLQTSSDGVHFAAPIQVTGPFGTSAAPATSGGHFLGDYEGLAAGAGKVYSLFVATNPGDKSNRTDVYLATK